MSSMPAADAHLADRVTSVQQQQSRPLPVCVQGATSQLIGVGEQFAGAGPPPPLQLHHVPSTPSAVSLLSDDISSGSSTLEGSADGGRNLQGVVSVHAPTRRMREFIPESKKDEEYWMKRHKNNEAAKRSREKRRANDAVMMRKIHELVAENKRLKLELDVLRRQLGIVSSLSQSQPVSCTTSALQTTPLAHLPADTLPPSRTKLESPSPVAQLSDASREVLLSGSYRPTAAVGLPPGHEQHRLKPNIYQASVAPAPAGGQWPVTSSISVSLTTSSLLDAGIQSYRATISGNNLPSIGNLCSTAARPDVASDAPITWTYRSTAENSGQRERERFYRPALAPSDRVVDSTPIVIFSDVSSSDDDDSVDDVLHGQNVDTLTLGTYVDNGGRAADADGESPLNLSTPSRYQSPALLRRAYTDDRSVVHRRSSVDFTPAPWQTAKSDPESLSEPATACLSMHRDDVMLLTNSGNYVFEGQSQPVHQSEWIGSPDDAQELQQRELSSRSTSLSSVASVAWQTGVDMVPPASAASSDDLVFHGQLSGAGELSARQAGCGLPLKVRRKLTGASTSRIMVDETLASDCVVGGVSTCHQSASGYGPGVVSSAAQLALSSEWFQSPAVPSKQQVEVSEYGMLDADSGR